MAVMALPWNWRSRQITTRAAAGWTQTLSPSPIGGGGWGGGERGGGGLGAVLVWCEGYVVRGGGGVVNGCGGGWGLYLLGVSGTGYCVFMCGWRGGDGWARTRSRSRS